MAEVLGEGFKYSFADESPTEVVSLKPDTVATYRIIGEEYENTEFKTGLQDIFTAVGRKTCC